MTHNNRGRLAVDLGGAWRIWWGNAPLPSGAQALGTITRDVGDTGALILLPSGQYRQGNAGAVRSLDQRKVAAAVEAAAHARGGARVGAGRATADGAHGVIRKNVTLDQSSIDKLRTLGDGDLSLGIRRAAAYL